MSSLHLDLNQFFCHIPLCITANFSCSKTPGWKYQAAFQSVGLTAYPGALDYSCLSVGHASPFFQLVKVTLNGSTAIWWCHSSQFCSICKLPESALCPFIWVINEDVKKYCAQHQPLDYVNVWDWDWFCDDDHDPPSTALQAQGILSTKDYAMPK